MGTSKEGAEEGARDGGRGTRGRQSAPKPQPSGSPSLDRSELPTAGLRDLTWTHFDLLARALAGQVRDYRPEVIIGIIKGGLYVGTALAGLLGCPFVPVRLNGRARDHGTVAPEARTAVPQEVRGRRVLIVDDVMQSGGTLARAREEAVAAGAAVVQAATLVVHAPRAGAARPDWFALETDDLVVFPWDFELRGGSTAADTDGFGA